MPWNTAQCQQKNRTNKKTLWDENQSMANILEKRDLLPNHGWFPKLFQNIFILKSNKRMFSETKVKPKINIPVVSQSVQLQSKNKKKERGRETSHRNGTVVHTETGTVKSSTLRENHAAFCRLAHSLAAVVEFAAVASVALHPQVAGGAWRRLTGDLRIQIGSWHRALGERQSEWREVCLTSRSASLEW